MKLGTENRKQVILLGVFGTLAVISIAYQFWPSSPPTATAPVVATSAVPASSPATTHQTAKHATSGKFVPVLKPSLDPTLDLDLLAESEAIKYAGNGRNIFAVGSVATIESPRAPGVTDRRQPDGLHMPAAAAPPPPITLKFFGFASKSGEPKRVFLSQGEDVFIAGEGDIVNRRYRVLRILPNSVEMEDVLYNNRQSIPLTQG